MPTLKETVILFGEEADPAIHAIKKRIEEAGREVHISHDFGAFNCTIGPCGQQCTCTTPCKSFIHPSYKPQ